MGKWLSERLQEPSTYVGLGSFLTAAGFAFKPEYWQWVAAIGMGIGGLLGAVISAKKSSD